MTKKSSKVTLAIKNISEDEMSISVKVEGLKPDHAAAEMVARALGRVFCFGSCGSWEHWVTHTDDCGISVDGIVTHESGRRLFLSIPATEIAFDGETGNALAEAQAFLWGAPRVLPQFARPVIDARAALHDRPPPRGSDQAVQNIMKEFGLPRGEARAVARFIPACYRYTKNFIRFGRFNV